METQVKFKRHLNLLQNIKSKKTQKKRKFQSNFKNNKISHVMIASFYLFLEQYNSFKKLLCFFQLWRDIVTKKKMFSFTQSSNIEKKLMIKKFRKSDLRLTYGIPNVG